MTIHFFMKSWILFWNSKIIKSFIFLFEKMGKLLFSLSQFLIKSQLRFTLKAVK